MENSNFLSKVSQIWLKSRCISVFLKRIRFFFKLSQKIDLSMSKYAEFHGDHVDLVQMSPNITQISIFINFINNRILIIPAIFRALAWSLGPAGWLAGQPAEGPAFSRPYHHQYHHHSHDCQVTHHQQHKYHKLHPYLQHE